MNLAVFMSEKKGDINNSNLIRKGLYILLGGFCLVIILSIVFQEPKIMLFYVFISFALVFMLVGIVFLMKKVKILGSSQAILTKILNSRKSGLQSTGHNVFYNPMYFHIFLVVLILLNIILSQFNLASYNNSYYNRFYDDLVFQFNVAILFSIIGVLNPFLRIPERVKSNINNKTLHCILNKNEGLFYSRLLACILVILYFIYKDWLVFSNFLQDNLVLKGIDIALLFFILNVTYRMIKYADVFVVENIFRVIKSFSIGIASLFVLVPLVPITMLSIHFLGMDDKSFNFEPIAFIGFNLIMIYVEYSLNKNRERAVSAE